jgi:hypothetical protein
VVTAANLIGFFALSFSRPNPKESRPMRTVTRTVALLLITAILSALVGVAIAFARFTTSSGHETAMLGATPTTGQPYGTIPLNSDLGGVWQDAAVWSATGTGTSAFGSGTNFSQKSNEVTWSSNGDGGVTSWSYEVQLTTVNAWQSCGTWTPALNTSTVWTCTVMCQDVTVFLADGGANNGGNWSTVLGPYNVTNTNGTPVVNPTTPTPVGTLSNVLTANAQVLVSDGGVQVQVEDTFASSKADCTCACQGTGGR